MSSDVPLQVGGAFLSAFIGSLFTAGDTAFTSLTAARVAALLDVAQGRKRKALLRIQRDEAKIRSRYLLGRIASTAFSSVLLSMACAQLDIPFAPYVGIGVTILVTSLLFEVSTTLGRKYADNVALMAARFLRPLEIVMLPVAIPLGWIAHVLGRQQGPVPDPKVVGAEVEIMVEEVERSGLVGHEPAEMIRNVLEFTDLTAKDAMVSRDKVEAIDVAMPMDQALAFITESGHSRYPVFRDQIDNVIGLLYAKDLFRAVEKRGLKSVRLSDSVRGPANFVHESQPLSSLLREMRSRRQHMAVVVSEFGTVSGIVTLEDILEKIVGDIRDEHDEVAIQDIGNGRIVADANITMEDLSTFLGETLQAKERNTSLSDVLTEHHGTVPQIGTSIEKYGLNFIVRDSNEHQIGKVEIVRPTVGAA